MFISPRAETQVVVALVRSLEDETTLPLTICFRALSQCVQDDVGAPRGDGTRRRQGHQRSAGGPGGQDKEAKSSPRRKTVVVVGGGGGRRSTEATSTSTTTTQTRNSRSITCQEEQDYPDISACLGGTYQLISRTQPCS